MVKIRAPRDFWAGVLFLVIGLLAAAIARNYAFGSTLRMGPGYMPYSLSWILAGLGLIVLVRSLRFDGPPVPRMQMGPLFFVLASIAVFGLTIERFGLVVSIMLTVLVGGLATREASIPERIIVSVGLAAFCAVVFVYALGQSMRVWPY